MDSDERSEAHAAILAAYRRLLSSSPDGIFAFDRELVCTAWNPGMTHLTAVPEQDAVSKRVTEPLRSLNYDDPAGWIEVLLDNTIILEDRVYTRPNGEEGYLTGHLSPLRDSTGSVIGGLGVLRDITESKRLARALQNRLRETLVLNRAISAAVSTFDITGALQNILTELANALEAPQGAIAMLTRSGQDLSVVADFHPPDEPSVLGAIIPIRDNPVTQYLLEEQVPLAITDVRRDERLSVVRALMTRRKIASMLLVPLIVREQVIGTLGLDSYTPRNFTVEEITLAQNVAAAVSQALDNAQLYHDLELERAYLMLANDAGRLLTAQMSIKGVIDATLSLAPRVGAMDAYALVLEEGSPLSFESTDAVSLTWSSAFRMEVAAEITRHGIERLALETHQPVIVQDTRTDPRWYEMPGQGTGLQIGSVVAVPFFGTRSRLSGVVGYTHPMPHRFDERVARVVELIGRYLTTALENARLFEQTQAALQERQRAENERLALERKMLEAQKLESLGVLAGGIAHDFNNLLVTMLGNASLALLEVPPGSRAHQYVEQIHVAAQRAADLTRQMLAYSGKGRFVVQPINLNDVIDEMVKLLRVSISKQATLQLNLAPHLPIISADATQLRQVIMNLITNASDALDERAGTITLSTGAIVLDRAGLAGAQPNTDLTPGEYVFLEVADTGSGMSAETRARMFEPFFTTKFTGRGLGLAAVLGIMRGHHGAIQVSSVVGEGTTFRLLFPPQAEFNSESPPLTTLFAPAYKAKILVVDDDAGVRQVTLDLLERFGYEALGAPDGAMALQVFEANHFDCVLLDLTMPGMSSEETLRQLRALTPNLRVILMSGYSEQDAAARFGNLRLDGFLQKPFLPVDLQDRTLAVLGKTSSHFK